METWNSSDARRHFGALLRAVLLGAPQKIRCRGKGSVVILSEQDWSYLKEEVSKLGDPLASSPLQPDDLPQREEARVFKRNLFD
ncbi:type II toxin-antitoxin system Phd/YefM family antitoxin [Ferruginivarius sediminum]|uniref:Antitoxin n=1 Tax=Ferruginivarius sediminum TaxID=2661937 RepID=A0A369T5I7_9PROT|nr:type II toxin-antitoxin system Phd/YefM family antitoxin [Ferruginivarius sediminum]